MVTLTNGAIFLDNHVAVSLAKHMIEELVLNIEGSPAFSKMDIDTLQAVFYKIAECLEVKPIASMGKFVDGPGVIAEG